MRRVTRLALGAGALALLAMPVAVAGAPAPAGPRLAVVKETWKPHRVEVLTVGPDGRAPMRIAGGHEGFEPVSYGRISWRPDGAELAFQGLRSIFTAKADGSGVHELNIADAERPVFASDGRTLAFTRFGGRREATTWTIDLASGVQRQLTPSRRGLEYVGSSFSPDGSTLLATRVDHRGSGKAEPVALDLASGTATRLLKRGFFPVYSPDGSKIALFQELGKRRVSDLFVLDVASRSLRRLTRTPDWEEVFASWDPSGQRIAFTRFRPGRPERASSIVQINADGSCENDVIAQRRRVVLSGLAWQPGPGREAGPISC